jgi:hypothetical protein
MACEALSPRRGPTWSGMSSARLEVRNSRISSPSDGKITAEHVAAVKRSDRDHHPGSAAVARPTLESKR